LAAALLAGCTGGSADSPDAPAPVPAADPAIARLVPQGIAQDGILTVATDADYPPLEFLGTDGQVQGADVDLAAAIAAILGLKPRFEQVEYANIARDVRTGRYEAGMSGLAVPRGERLLNNAVLYLVAGSQLVRADYESDVTRKTLCGRTVAVIEGSRQNADLAARSAKCRRRGADPVDIVAAPGPDEATDVVLAGEAAGLLAESTVTQDVVARHPDELEPASSIYATRPLGIVTAAEYTRFTTAIRRALQQLIDSGYYAEVLDRWSIVDGRVAEASVVWAGFAAPGRARRDR
jgi:polar amino acid transport system substrate-binding protein